VLKEWTSAHPWPKVNDVKRLAQAVSQRNVPGPDAGSKYRKLVNDFNAVLKEFQQAQRTCSERELASGYFLPQAAAISGGRAGSASGYGRVLQTSLATSQDAKRAATLKPVVLKAPWLQRWKLTLYDKVRQPLRHLV
jgi:hypothetical protein